jgi:hypothetical protein
LLGFSDPLGIPVGAPSKTTHKLFSTWSWTWSGKRLMWMGPGITETPRVGTLVCAQPVFWLVSVPENNFFRSPLQTEGSDSLSEVVWASY